MMSRSLFGRRPESYIDVYIIHAELVINGGGGENKFSFRSRTVSTVVTLTGRQLQSVICHVTCSFHVILIYVFPLSLVLLILIYRPIRVTPYFSIIFTRIYSINILNNMLAVY